MFHTELVIPSRSKYVPLTLEILKEMCIICLSHFNPEFKITHRKLKWDTLSITTLFNLRTG